ncbi:hypothetical protein ACKKBG_A05900 [Auxenochlorella protothecoides x Auxenochlorella symbiontica]
MQMKPTQQPLAWPDYNHHSLKDHPGPRSQPHATLLPCPSCIRVHPGAPSRRTRPSSCSGPDGEAGIIPGHDAGPAHRPDVKFMHRPWPRPRDRPPLPDRHPNHPRTLYHLLPSHQVSFVLHDNLNLWTKLRGRTGQDGKMQEL